MAAPRRARVRTLKNEHGLTPLRIRGIDRVRIHADAPHGFREFGVYDPGGHDIAFGQPLADIASPS